MGSRGNVEGVLVIVVVCGADSTWSLGTFCSIWVGIATVDCVFGCKFVRLSEQQAVSRGESVGLSAVRGVLDGLLANVLVESVGCSPVDLVFVLLLAALSSSSDEISTTIWTGIMGVGLWQSWRS